MTSAWDRFNKENNQYPVGQLADLETKKKGSSKKTKEESTPLRNQIHALQEQNAAAMIREIEYKTLLRKCHQFIDDLRLGDGPIAVDKSRLLAELKAVD